MNFQLIASSNNDHSITINLDRYSTPKKTYQQALNNSTAKSSADFSSNKLCSIFSNDKPQH
jgi:Homeodomain